MKILVFGDSIAYGAWDVDGGWVSRLRKFYDKRGFKDENYFMLFYQLGIDSQTTADLLERFDAESKPRVDENRKENVIIFEVGKNDSLFKESIGRRRVEPSEFERNLRELSGKASKVSETIIFLGMARTADDTNLAYKAWTPDITYSNEAILEYDSIIKRICKETGAGYIDLDKAISKRISSGIFDNDGIHLNAKGHRLVFNAVKRYLIKNGITPQHGSATV